MPHEFKGEYVRLQNNPKWRRISLETNDTRLVFADIITKVNRKNAKVRTKVKQSWALIRFSVNCRSIKDRSKFNRTNAKIRAKGQARRLVEL